jgi:hypothetical protein
MKSSARIFFFLTEPTVTSEKKTSKKEKRVSPFPTFLKQRKEDAFGDHFEK